MKEWGFDFEKDGYHFVSVEKANGNSEITISKDEMIIRKFLFPSYKIWNISAHADDIISGLKQGNDSGLRIAGNDGLGGNSYSS